MNKKDIALGLALFVLGLGLYIADLNNILFLDDLSWIVNNDSIKEFNMINVSQWFTENASAGVSQLTEYYRPLLLASFAVNYAVHGLEPVGYLLTNNIIHALNAVLVFWLLISVLKKRWLAFLSALIFLVHPMQSENVAYISSRGDLLSSFFMLSGLIIWVKGIELKRSFLSMFLSSVFLILALLSRENGVVFPFLAIVIFVAFLSQKVFWKSLRDAFVYVVPHLIIVAVYFSLRLTVLNFRDFLNFGNYDTSSLYAQNIFIRLYTFMHVLLEYLRTYLWPTNVHFRFLFPIHESLFDWPVLGGVSLILLIFVIGFIFYKKEDLKSERQDSKQIQNSKYISNFRIWVFGWGWFFVALSPGSGIIPTNTIIHDHRLYLAMVSISALGLYCGWRGIEYMRTRGFGFVRLLILSMFALYIGFLSWITVERSIIWGKPNELFAETLQYEPNATVALNQVGVYHLERGEYDKAEHYFRTAIEQGTRFPQAYNNMGYILQTGPEKDLNKAILYYTKAIELDPQSWLANQHLAEIYMEQGDAKAVYHLKKLNELRPKDANIHYNLALMLNALGKKDEALQWVIKGLTLVENDTFARQAFEELKTKIMPLE